MKASVSALACVSFLAFLLASCTSVSHYQAIDEAVARGDYSAGLEELRGAKEQAYKPKDQVLYYLDEGMLAHYAGDYKESSQSLGTAERAIELAVTKSVSMEVSSYLVNDNSLEYPGEDYEDIYLNVFNSLNYYYSGSIEGALVEVRRIDNKIKYLSTKYGGAITNAQKAIMDKSSEIPYDSEAATIKFSNSALGRYLGMLLYRSEGKFDDARIDRDQVKLAFANQPSLYGFPLPKALDEELSVPRGKARLNVISFSGLSPVKTESVIRIGLGSSNWLKIAVPVITYRKSEVSSVRLRVDGFDPVELDLLEDMGAVAMETFKQKAALIYLKTVLRSLAKTSSSMIMEEQANETSNADAALLLSVLSIGTQIYAEASEQADLRLSRYFPSKAHVAGVTLDPGVYSWTIEYLDAGGNVLHSVRNENREIRSNALNLSEAVCIR